MLFVSFTFLFVISFLCVFIFFRANFVHIHTLGYPLPPENDFESDQSGFSKERSHYPILKLITFKNVRGLCCVGLHISFSFEVSPINPISNLLGTLPLQDDIKEYLDSRNVDWEESADLMDVASQCDVVYQTRIQRERFGDRIDLYNEARGKYIVDSKVMEVLQPHAVILHPLPRLDEVSNFSSLSDYCPQQRPYED